MTRSPRPTTQLEAWTVFPHTGWPIFREHGRLYRQRGFTKQASPLPDALAGTDTDNTNSVRLPTRANPVLTKDTLLC
jgi:hypothetical protein